MENNAKRYNDGKRIWSLVDFDSMEDLVKVLEFGKDKYSIDNWKKGLTYESVMDSLLRHSFAFLNGEDLDSESKLPHTGHILANAMFLSYMYKNRKDMDNRRIKTKSMLNRKQLELEYIRLGNLLESSNYKSFKNHCYWRMANDNSCKARWDTICEKPFYKNCDLNTLKKSVEYLSHMAYSPEAKDVIDQLNINSLIYRDKINIRNEE